MRPGSLSTRSRGLTMTHPGSLSPPVPATAQVLAEAEALSADILKDIELSQVRLAVVALKALRLARLLNDFDVQQMFEWESGGYPSGASGDSPEVWTIGQRAGRVFFGSESTPDNPKSYMYTESVEEMEHTAAMGTASIQAAQDPNISISSANKYQHVHAPMGNASERSNVRRQMRIASERLASRRTLIYSYAARKHYELKFAGLADDVFGRIRSSVDASIGLVVPDAVKKLTAVYDNLKSDNPEDWANAAHSCRRVLQDLADAVFPVQAETRTRSVNGKEVEIRLGAENYINRLVAFVEDSLESSRFNEIVGSHLHYMGDRLDALFGAAQKGSHATVTREEANRCVVYTYLMVGDILSLRVPQPLPTQFDAGHETGPGPVEGPQSQPLVVS